MYPEGKIQQKNLFEYWKYINIFSTLCPHIPLQVKILTGIKSRSVKGKYVYVVLFTQPETDTTKNVVLSKMVLMQLVPLVYRCSDLDKAHSSISGWWNSAFTTFTVSLWTLFVYGSKKDRGGRGLSILSIFLCHGNQAFLRRERMKEVIELPTATLPPCLLLI